MDKIYILTEYGGSYEDVWEKVEAASFDKEYLDQLAQKHNEEQKRKKWWSQTLKEVTEIPIIKR
jgi:hypothetical protein